MLRAAPQKTQLWVEHAQLLSVWMQAGIRSGVRLRAVEVQYVQVLTVTPALSDPPCRWEDVIAGYGMSASHYRPYGDTKGPNRLQFACVHCVVQGPLALVC